MIHESPRVRFAPSPTGYLHVGGLRTALYNYLYAKKLNGAFVLRIEDTDRTRYVEGAVENLIATLQWAGLDFDEGPIIGGDYGPYLQSERLDIYKQHAQQLIASGDAYYCFCNAERIEKVREEQKAIGIQPRYDKHCLALSKEEVQQKLDAGEPYVIRLNVRPGGVVGFDDEIREHVEFSTDVIDDQVLMKSDGFPTYHLANVVDDHLMKITMVIRGEEWLSSTPKHILLYDAFGWEKPKFAHLPLLLNADRSKLSKRQGDVAVESYREKGYLKEAILNFIALLGWHGPDDKELYTIAELIEAFSLERVSKSGAVFDLQKLAWLNQEYLKTYDPKLMIPEFRTSIEKQLHVSLEEVDDEWLIDVFIQMRERINVIDEVAIQAPYFFLPPDVYDEKSVGKNWNTEASRSVTELANRVEVMDDPSKEDYEAALRMIVSERGINAGKLIHPVRLAVSGVSGGPGLFDILYLIGKDETVERLRTAVERLG